MADNDKLKKLANWAVFSVKCCNPLKETHHFKSRNLRNVTNWMCTLGLEGVEEGMKVCDGCRLKICKRYKNNSNSNDDDKLTGDNSQEDCSYTDPTSSLDYLNKSLELVGESPIKKKKLKTDSYARQKFDKVKLSLEKNFVSTKIAKPETKEIQAEKDESEIITQLKKKFLTTTKGSEKMMILSVLPQSWSRSRITNEFGVSDYMARAVKKLVKEKGVLSTPNPKPGKTLDTTTVEIVIDFYNCDDISRVMPGKKDVVTVRRGKEDKLHLQKRLILLNLNEAYTIFKEENPGHQIGFSKFCDLRPKNCILAGKSGTHTVCVCLIHQNVKLMMNGSKMHSFVLDGDEVALKNYQTCLYKIMCNPASPICYLNTCKECPGIEPLKALLRQKFEDEMIDSVTIKKWMSVDRCTLETVVKEKDEFIEDFSEAILKLKTHSFLANMQKEFYRETKTNLEEGEVVVTCDFSENYSFVLQDEVQSYHWTNSQATLHPFVVYYRGEDSKIQHLNYVFISECLTHNTVAFNLFQTHLINALKEDIPGIKIIYYFSDGCAGQYKNRKNFQNICLHKKDFGIDAEWHFFATSHGKSACDGLGGTVKRLAMKASLQRPYDQQIMTPHQLYEFAATNIPGIKFKYCTIEEHNENEERLATRFDKTKTIKGTHNLHAVIPISDTQMATKLFSSSTERKLQAPVITDSVTAELEEIESGFVTVMYDNFWWLACILGKNNETNEVKVSFLHPRGPAASFFYPQPRLDILDVSTDTLLKKVEPRTATGRTYTLTTEEMADSSHLLEQQLKKM